MHEKCNMHVSLSIVIIIKVSSYTSVNLVMNEVNKYYNEMFVWNFVIYEEKGACTRL